MSIVLIYPFRRSTDGGAGPPIGLLYLATYLKKNNFETTVIDLVGEESSDDIVIDRIVNSKPAMIGFPLYSVNMSKVYNFSTQLRQKGYKGKIVVGAQHATGLPEQTMKNFQQIDYLIKYEAEIPLTKLAEHVVNGKGNLNDIENLYYRNGTIKHTVDVPDINRNIDDLPFPDRSLLDKYYKKGLYNRPYVKGDCDFMICARGCPFRCNFCFPSAFSFRSRSPQNIIDELRYLRSLGRKHIEIMDDTFTVNKKRLEETLNSIISENLGLSFKIRSRVDVMDEKMAALMKAAGVKMIVYGIESGSDKMLKAMNKRTTAAKNAEAIQITKNVGILCFADMFIGYPGEDSKSIKETIKFLTKTRPTGINLGVYYPLPLTTGYETAKANGTLIGDWSHQHDKQPFVKLDWIEDVTVLHKIAQQIRRKFYLNPVVFSQTAFFILRNTKLRDLPKFFMMLKRKLFKLG